MRLEMRAQNIGLILKVPNRRSVSTPTHEKLATVSVPHTSVSAYGWQQQPLTVIEFFSVAEKKNEAAVALGRLGGAKKVPKGMSMLTEAQKREIAMKGVEARRSKAGKKNG
jgi:hypothetical protein